MTQESMTVEEAREFRAASHITNKLSMHYPHHRWATKVSNEQGVVFITMPELVKENIYFIINQRDFMHSEKALDKLVMRAGGELLERLSITRERKRESTVDDLVNSVERDFKGDAPLNTDNSTNWAGQDSARKKYEKQQEAKQLKEQIERFNAKRL